jgi:nucleoside 2-deoxyribosyltransferase
VSGPRPRCYVASPLGFNEPGRSYYNEVYLPALSAAVEPVDPWKLTTAQEIDDARSRNTLREMRLEIGRRNIEAIKSSDMLAALLDGQEPDSGTVAELGYAAGLGKRCFALRSDLRQAGEEGGKINLQVEAFVIGSGGAMTTTLAELVTELERASRELSPKFDGRACPA